MEIETCELLFTNVLPTYIISANSCIELLLIACLWLSLWNMHVYILEVVFLLYIFKFCLIAWTWIVCIWNGCIWNVGTCPVSFYGHLRLGRMLYLWTFQQNERAQHNGMECNESLMNRDTFFTMQYSVYFTKIMIYTWYIFCAIMLKQRQNQALETISSLPICNVVMQNSLATCKKFALVFSRTLFSEDIHSCVTWPK